MDPMLKSLLILKIILKIHVFVIGSAKRRTLFHVTVVANGVRECGNISEEQYQQLVDMEMVDFRWKCPPCIEINPPKYNFRQRKPQDMNYNEQQ